MNKISNDHVSTLGNVLRDRLKGGFHQYIQQNNPDLLSQLEADGKVTEYLSDKLRATDELLKQLQDQPEYLAEEVCMEVLTKELRPSKYNYICDILSEEFETPYHQLQESGTLKFEVINLVQECVPVFEGLGFTEADEDNRQLRYAIMGVISEYMEVTGANENVSNELQQPTKVSG